MFIGYMIYGLMRSFRNNSVDINDDELLRGFDKSIKYEDEDEIEDENDEIDDEKYYFEDIYSIDKAIELQKEYNNKIVLEKVDKVEENNILLAKFVNNNDKTITGVLAYMVYYDENNRIAKIDEEMLSNVEPHGEFYFSYEDLSKYYNKYEVYAFCDGDSDEKNIKDKVSFEIEDKKDDYFLIKTKGIDLEESELQFVVKYYDEKGNIVYVNNIEEDGMEKKNIFRGDHVKHNLNKIKYNRYEVELVYVYDE